MLLLLSKAQLRTFTDHHNRTVEEEKAPLSKTLDFSYECVQETALVLNEFSETLHEGSKELTMHWKKSPFAVPAEDLKCIGNRTVDGLHYH